MGQGRNMLGGYGFASTAQVKEDMQTTSDDTEVNLHPQIFKNEE